MKKNLQLALLFICISTFSASAQDYKGLWHGYITEYDFDVTSGYVLQVKEHKGNIITGRAYIYSKKYFVFQGMLDFIGTIDKANSKVTELVIVKSEMPINLAFLCVKFLNLTFSKKDDIETLTGKWSGASEKRECRPGEVYLQRYALADSSQIDRIPDPIFKVISEDHSPIMIFAKTELTQPIILNVTSSVLTIEMSDYLREDNDTVSVYYNRKPIISNLQIRKRAFKKTVTLDKLSGLNEVIIYAENLGGVPPNTCLLTVNDGVTKQRVNISSSKQTSAVIYLNYVPKSSKSR